MLSGSLAVFGFTGNEDLEVHDIDLARSAAEFPRLLNALEDRGIVCAVRDHHVMQAHAFRVVALSSLIELYRRGLGATADETGETASRKRSALERKFEALASIP